MAARWIGTLVLATCLGLAGCAGDAGDGIAMDEPIGAPAPDAGGATGPLAAVEKRATLQVEVPRDDLSRAAQAVVDAATAPGIGGFLVSSTLDLDEGYGYGSVLVRVPAQHFEPTVSALARIGELTHQQVTGQDLTAQALAAIQEVQTATSRARALSAQLNETRDAAAALRNRLRAARRSQREASSEQAYVDTQTAYSPIEVGLSGKRPPPAPRSPVEDALSTARGIALAVVSGVVVAAGAVLPVATVLALVYLLWSRVARRLRVRLES